MDRICGVLLLSVLFLGCRQGAESPQEAMVLCGSMGGVSKTDALTAGDEVAVFARLDGTEHYFLEAAKFTTGSDGKTLSATPAVYYPKPKQAVNFYAYFPYHTGVFSVPTDQSTASALKKADLCWTTTSTTPVPTPVSLEFQHLFARLIVQTNTSTEKIAIPNTFLGGTLDIKTGAFTNTLKSEVFTTGPELILPAQSVTRLVLTVSGVEYVFEGPISLLSGQTTTLNLTFNAPTKTATLNGSSTTAWTTSATQGNATQAVSNILTLHWPNYEPKGAAPTQVTLTIGGTDYTVSNGITYANKTFTVPFASVVLTYPYTISNIAFLGVPQHATQLVGATVYKSGGQTVGINDKLGNPINPPLPSDYVKIGSLYWAKGNLVATSNVASGNNGCKVGSQYDGGLYFQFGSLIGWKGGALANGGTGVGYNPYIDYVWWGGATSWSWANDAMVWPTSMTKSPSEWPTNTNVETEATAFKTWFFNFTGTSGGVNYSARGSDIRSYTHPTLGSLVSGGMASWGIGDPCSYYLGANWRLPTAAECSTVFDGAQSSVSWAALPSWTWSTGPYFGAMRVNEGLTMPASGYRYEVTGAFAYVTGAAYYMSTTIYNAITGVYVYGTPSGVNPQNAHTSARTLGFPARCVSSAP